MALEKELQTYKKNLSNWKEHEGKFVLIQGENVDGFYGTYDEAIRQGYTKYGADGPFLVKQVNSLEKAHFATFFHSAYSPTTASTTSSYCRTDSSSQIRTLPTRLCGAASASVRNWNRKIAP